MRSATVSNRREDHSSAEVLTAVESSFRNPKLRTAALVAYKCLADGTAKGVLFVITIAAAHRLSPFAFGVFGLGTTVGWMLAVIADFGVQMHLARAVARSPGSSRSLLAGWWRVRVASAASTIGLLVAMLVMFRVERRIALPVAGFALAYGLTGLVDFFNYFYRGLSRSDIESTLLLGQRAGTLVLASVVLVWRPDATWLAIAFLLPAMLTALWSFRVAGRLTAPSSLEPAIGGSFVRDVFPIGLGVVLSALYFRIDVLLVQLWAGTESVARYNAVFRVIDALRLFPAAVLAVALPELCAASTLARLASVSAAVTAFAAIVTMLVWIAADRLVLLLFGAEYADAARALRVLALSFPLLSLNLALTHQLVGWNRQRAYAATCAACLVVNLGLNAWLIPVLSVEGAAWATLGTEVCLTSGCVAALWMRA